MQTAQLAPPTAQLGSVLPLTSGGSSKLPVGAQPLQSARSFGIAAPPQVPGQAASPAMMFVSAAAPVSVHSPGGMRTLVVPPTMQGSAQAMGGSVTVQAGNLPFTAGHTGSGSTSPLCRAPSPAPYSNGLNFRGAEAAAGLLSPRQDAFRLLASSAVPQLSMQSGKLVSSPSMAVGAQFGVEMGNGRSSRSPTRQDMGAGCRSVSPGQPTQSLRTVIRGDVSPPRFQQMVSFQAGSGSRSVSPVPTSIASLQRQTRMGDSLAQQLQALQQAKNKAREQQVLNQQEIQSRQDQLRREMLQALDTQPSLNDAFQRYASPANLVRQENGATLLSAVPVRVDMGTPLASSPFGAGSVVAMSAAASASLLASTPTTVTPVMAARPVVAAGSMADASSAETLPDGFPSAEFTSCELAADRVFLAETSGLPAETIFAEAASLYDMPTQPSGPPPAMPGTMAARVLQTTSEHRSGAGDNGGFENTPPSANIATAFTPSELVPSEPTYANPASRASSAEVAAERAAAAVTAAAVASDARGWTPELESKPVAHGSAPVQPQTQTNRRPSGSVEDQEPPQVQRPNRPVPASQRPTARMRQLQSSPRASSPPRAVATARGSGSSPQTRRGARQQKPAAEPPNPEFQAELERCRETIDWCADQLNSKLLRELRNFRQPPAVLRTIFEAMGILLGSTDPRSGAANARTMLSGNVPERLRGINLDDVTLAQFRKVRRMLVLPEFEEERVRSVCAAALPLATWCRSIGVCLSKTRFLSLAGPEIQSLGAQADEETGRGSQDRQRSADSGTTPNDEATPQSNNRDALGSLELGSLVVRPDLSRLSAQDLQQVSELTVCKPEVGSITFHGPTDCSDLDLSRLVHLGIGEVLVYPEPGSKAPIGQGLNKRATVTMYQCWPPNGRGHLEDQKAQERYRYKIQQMTEDKRAKFIDYDCSTGVWKFQVEHF